MQHTKITITKEELSVMQNVSFLQTKIKVMEKMKHLLMELHNEINKEATELKIPKQLLSNHGKISKGENYKGMPYLILDYPRNFNKQNIFAVRSMFWWGNYFLFMLHVQGELYKGRMETVLKNLYKAKEKDVFIYLGNDPWQHELKSPANKHINDIKEFPANPEFIKLSIKLNLDEWDQLPQKGREAFRFFMKISGADDMS